MAASHERFATLVRGLTDVILSLDEHGVMQVGRYARWVFQGIADSVRDGLMAGATVDIIRRDKVSAFAPSPWTQPRGEGPHGG